MWTDTQVVSAMGLQATATKRKYETGSCNDDNDIYLNCAPAPKTGRWSNQINSNLTISSIATPNTMITNCNTNVGSSIENNIAKLEAVVNVPHEPWDSEPIVDSISKLQAVAVPDAWGSDSTRSTLATTLLSADEFDDDEDDFDDEFEEDESIIPTYCPIRYPCPPQRNYGHNGYLKPNFYSEPFPQQNCSRTGNQQSQQSGRLGSGYSWNNQNSNYYVPPEASYPQQTIRCAENGKSYLELGSSSFNASMGARHPKRCCDGRGTWCNNKNCYKEIRLKIRNLSMFKLSRFRQVSEQSLYRSVLICNTLKYIDKEMEAEGKDATQFGVGADYMPAPGSIRVLTPTLQSATLETSNQSFQQSSFSSNGNNSANNNSNSNANSNNSSSSNSSSSNNNSNDGNRDFTQSFNTSNNAKPASSLSFNSSCSNDPLHPYDHHPFRDSMSGRATPFPSGGLHPDTDSGYGDDDSNRPINWSSVLNLTSQSALDPLNNNDLFSTIPSTSITTSTTSTNLSNSNASSTFTASTSMSTCSVTQVSSASSTWEYGFLDMDLGLGSEFTELLPGWKLSSDDILKSVSPSLNPTKSIHETELETPTHIMVGS